MISNQPSHMPAFAATVQGSQSWSDSALTICGIFDEQKLVILAKLSVQRLWL